MRVYVLLFNARTENEGIHTIQMGGRNKILMFESEDDATRFALLLEAQDFPVPTVEVMDSGDIEAFCREADYECEMVGDGMLAIPPENNVPEPDWDTENPKPREPETEETESDIPQSELDSIRRRLEGLL
jgi:hypothetical protein